MKATLEFDLPEDIEEFRSASNGHLYKSQVEEIWSRVFRPRHKHGYGSELDKLLETPEVGQALDILEKLYFDAKAEFSLNED